MKCKDVLESGQVVYVRAITKKSGSNTPTTLVVNDPVERIQDVVSRETKEIHLHIQVNAITKNLFVDLKAVVEENHGAVPLVLCVHTSQNAVAFVETSEQYSVSISKEFLQNLCRLLGDKCYKIKANENVPQPRQHIDWKKDEES